MIDETLSIGGLSPHIRGNAEYRSGQDRTLRSIPAHTGERTFNVDKEGQISVYPRTYGGTHRLTDKRDPRWGLSPHIRGNGFSSRPLECSTGSIPAHTGERALLVISVAFLRVYPRTYGGTSLTYLICASFQGLSPHIRGNDSVARTRARQLRSIPAHTGERLSGRSTVL